MWIQYLDQKLQKIEKKNSEHFSAVKINFYEA